MSQMPNFSDESCCHLAIPTPTFGAPRILAYWELARKRLREVGRNSIEMSASGKLLGRVVAVPSLCLRLGGVLEKHGMAVIRPHERNFRKTLATCED